MGGYKSFVVSMVGFSNRDESKNVGHQSCPALCDTMDYSLPSSSVHGILQARTLEWVAVHFSRGSSLTQGLNSGLLPALQTDSLPSKPLGGGLVTKSCPTLVTPMDCSLPGSSAHGIFHARILEWVAISFPRKNVQ